MKDMKDTDYRKKLYEYLMKNIAKGYDPESLKWALVSQGYTRTDVDKAIAEIKAEREAEAKRASEEKQVVQYDFGNGLNQEFQPKKPWWKKILFWMD